MNATSLLGKYFPDDNSLPIILEHSRLVADKALQIARNLDLPSDDQRFIEEAALLHDIGICRTFSPKIGCNGTEPYIRHGLIGRDILEKEGLPLHALVCERHIGVGLSATDVRSQNLPLPEKEMSPVSLAERIVCFADLFYSKRPEEISREKSLEEIKRDLGRFGEHKVEIFVAWLAEFS